MDEILIYSTIIAALGILLFALYFAKSKSPSTDERERARRRAAIPTRDEDGHIIADQESLVAAGPRGRRGARMQRRPQVAPRPNVEEDNESNEDDEEISSKTKLDGKVGKKKLEKLQAKADKKAAREAEVQMREEEKKKKELKDAEREKAALKEKEDEDRAEEEERRKREEKERREEEEYRKLAESFAVEEEGFDEIGEGEDGDQENMLQAFIQYIQDTKVVVLEDLAAHFKMKAQDAIDRVTQLSEQGQLTGVMDDRGKFIYISQVMLAFF